MVFSQADIDFLMEVLYTYCLELRHIEKHARRWGNIAFANLCDRKAIDAKKLYVTLEGFVEED